MGCDIHPVVQYQRTISGSRMSWWNEFGIPPRERSYDFFAVLAGVRDYDGALAKAGLGEDGLFGGRGYPADVAAVLAEEHEEDNWERDKLLVYLSHEHSASWCTLRELQDALPRVQAIADLLDRPWIARTWRQWIRMGQLARTFYRYTTDDPDGIASADDVRFVFDFDS